MSASEKVRTTVMLREDLYQKLKRDPRGMSESINEALEHEYGHPKDMFGSTPKDLDFSDIRDHADRV